MSSPRVPFCDGLIHIGEKKIVAGRMNEKASLGLSATMARAGFKLGRPKTGTPPRLDGRTIDWDSLEMQAADEESLFPSPDDRPHREPADRVRHNPHDAGDA